MKPCTVQIEVVKNDYSIWTNSDESGSALAGEQRQQQRQRRARAARGSARGSHSRSEQARKSVQPRLAICVNRLSRQLGIRAPHRPRETAHAPSPRGIKPNCTETRRARAFWPAFDSPAFEIQISMAGNEDFPGATRIWMPP